MDELTISCDECSLDGTSACQDCVVTFLLASEQTSCFSGEVHPSGHGKQAVVVDASEMRAMRLLHSAGLVPTLRFERRVG